MNTNTPFYIRCEQYNREYGIFENKSDLTYTEVLDMFLDLSETMGFQQSTIKAVITKKALSYHDTDDETI